MSQQRNELESLLIKFKLCIRLIKKEDIKVVCNELVKYNLTKAKPYEGKNENSAYHVMYSLFINFKKYGLSGLINMQGKSKKKSSKRNLNKIIDDVEKERQKAIERKNQFTKILEKLPAEELLKIIDIYDEFFRDVENDTTYIKIQKVKRLQEVGISISKKDLLILCNIATSTFYKYQDIKPGIKGSCRHDKLRITKLISKIYYDSYGNYGVKRIWIILVDEYGIKISKKTVHKYMKELKIMSMIRRKNKRRIDAKNTHYKCENILNRRFENTKENNVICTDVTYLKTLNGFYYLSASIDLRNNEIVGWKISETNNTQLVIDSFENINLKDYSIVHSDHGVQYATNEFKYLLKINGVVQSMSRVANSLDNRPIEYWFSIYKEEFLRYLDLNVIDLGELIRKTNEFIDYYNNRRIQTNLYNLTPNEYKEYLLTGKYPSRWCKTKTFSIQSVLY